MIPQRISDVYVNLKGRYPQGTVDPADYEQVQSEIIDALLDLRNPDGERAVALALRKRDAQIINHYGPETGDVLFVFNAFHGRTKLPKGELVRRARGGANHGPQIATTRTAFSSDLASAIIAGPGIRQGYVRDAEKDGLWKLIDVAPTIAHLLGFQPPRESRGGVLYDLLQNAKGS
jgi:predicted AlkP superfamily phosphohydrolase/phosphomutase